MPRPALPPTPASSTDIQAREMSQMALQLPHEMVFSLPPPALVGGCDNKTATKNAAHGSPTTSPYAPASPVSPVMTNDTHSSSTKKESPNGGNGAFQLPPPPTRSRRIIQVTPKTAPVDQATGKKTPAKKASAAMNKDNGAAAKQTKPPATTAAKKKVARKTAHSVIERRRRSKMNDEFATLKGMIPACRDQEMHKLSILQAGIDYVRYLEQCIVDLKAARTRSAPSPAIPPQSQSNINFNSTDGMRPPTSTTPDTDTQMSNSPVSVIQYQPSHHHQPSISSSYSSSHPSPFLDYSLHSHSSRDHRQSVTSQTITSPSFHAFNTPSTHARRSISPLASPMQLPQAHASFEPSLKLLSPAMDPRSHPQDNGSDEMQLDPAADGEESSEEKSTAAALLLLGSGKRSSVAEVETSRSGSVQGRALSVRDLLTR